MKNYRIYLLLLLIIIIGCNPVSTKTDNQRENDSLAKAQPIGGQAVSEVMLKTPEGRDTLLSSIINNKVSVFIFLAPDCPLSQNYTLTLNEFSKNYLKNNIYFYGIFPGTLYSTEQINYFRKMYNVEFPLLMDTAYALTKMFNATVTPEAFLTDNKCMILYSGRIDNWAYEVSKKRTQITEHDLQNALDCIVTNTPIKVKKTDAVGCFIEIPKK